jgi:hypothetical protein
MTPKQILGGLRDEFEAPTPLGKMIPKGEKPAAEPKKDAEPLGDKSAVPSKLSPTARAIAAAYDMEKDEEGITLKAVCDRAQASNLAPMGEDLGY